MSRITKLACGAAAAALILAAPAGAATKPRWYLSLGDSLARGVQPDATGENVVTADGYPDQLFTTLKRSTPRLRLKKLGCPGETTASFMQGGICKQRKRSQLSLAKSFLRKHRGEIALVTVNVGANDVAGCATTTSVDFLCAAAGAQAVADNAPKIAAQLRRAAGSKTLMVGMTYYDPFLAASLTGPAGVEIANASLALLDGLNQNLAGAWRANGMRVADGAKAFETTVTTPLTVPGIGTVPTNVARICQLTWMCAPAPVGPNIHANDAGYQLLADTFRKAAGKVR